MDDYVYTTLFDPSSQIRLLTIPFGWFVRYEDQPLYGTISTHSLALESSSRLQRLTRSVKLPLFKALSYVWGDSTLSHEIIVDGKKLRITANLYDALRGLQSSSVVTLRIWADAICINQSDNDEKSAQIPLMRHIYEQAEEVRVYLGPSTDDSFRCMSLIAELTSNYPPTKAEKPIISDPDDEKIDNTVDKLAEYAFTVPAVAFIDSGVAFGHHMQSGMEALWPDLLDSKAKVVSASERAEVEKLVGSEVVEWQPKSKNIKDDFVGEKAHITAELLSKVLIKNPTWFERVWVVQELCAANDANVQFGSYSQQWESCMRTLYWLQNNTDAEVEGLDEGMTLEMIRAAFRMGYRHSLQYLLHTTRYRKATDPRDKIFALLGLSGDEQSNPLLKPDYDLPVAQVFANVTLYFLRHTKSLNPILSVMSRERQEKLPSWVPDYSITEDTGYLRLTTLDQDENLFCASGNDFHSSYLDPRTGDMPMDWHYLPTQGLLIDLITHASGVLPAEDDSPCLRVEKWIATVIRSFDGSDTSSVSQLLEFRHNLEVYSNIQEKQVKRSKASGEEYTADTKNISCLFPNEPSIAVAGFIEVLCCGMRNATVRLAPNDVMKWYESGMEASQSQSHHKPSTMPKSKQKENINTKRPKASTSKSSAGKASPVMSIDELLEVVDASTKHRQLVTTSKGYFGAAPVSAEVGDHVCVLFGCNVPVVLRKVVDHGEQNQYKLVGECFLRGFMDAEAIVMLIKKQLVAQEIILC